MILGLQIFLIQQKQKLGILDIKIILDQFLKESIHVLQSLRVTLHIYIHRMMKNARHYQLEIKK